jgi:hypothetical protein
MGASPEVMQMVFESACMRGHVGRALLAIALAAPFAVIAGGCSSTSSPVAPTVEAEAVCPATPADTVGKACPSEGTICGPQYACGNTSASLYCVCTGGTFACRDGTGNALKPGDTPACPSVPPAPPACPSSLAAASLHACTAPGQICAYPSVCRGAYDQCYCFPGETAAGGFGTVFVCQPAICATDAAAPPPADAGPMSDAPFVPDATVDAGPMPEAAVDDASPEAASDAAGAQD